MISRPMFALAIAGGVLLGWCGCYFMFRRRILTWCRCLEVAAKASAELMASLMETSRAQEKVLYARVQELEAEIVRGANERADLKAKLGKALGMDPAEWDKA